MNKSKTKCLDKIQLNEGFNHFRAYSIITSLSYFFFHIMNNSMGFDEDVMVINKSVFCACAYECFRYPKGEFKKNFFHEE